MNDNWNFNMDEAPRGRTETQRFTAKGKVYEREFFVSEKIIACAKDGHVVTTTRWLPCWDRWEMFASGEEPLCWMPWPEHPKFPQTSTQGETQ